MDYDKLIERLRTESLYADKASLEIMDLCMEAATALSTLQEENEKLRAELEYEKEHANAYYEECGQWEVENAQLKEKVEALQRERDSIEQDFRAFAKQLLVQIREFRRLEWKVKHPGEICEGRAFEWRGPQKED